MTHDTTWDEPATCTICGHVQVVFPYDGWTCARCGCVWEYNEGHHLVLTPAMLEAVRRVVLVIGGEIGAGHGAAPEGSDPAQDAAKADRGDGSAPPCNGPETPM